MLDATCSQPSIEEFSTGFGFTKEKINWYFNQYLPLSIDKYQEQISPIFSNNLKGLPPTLMATAAYDPLRDEGELFGEKLKEAGVETKIKRYEGMIHGFFQMAGFLDQGKVLINDIAEELRVRFSN